MGLSFQPAQSFVKEIALYALLCQFAVEVIEVINAGCESGHHMAAWMLPLLTIDIVSQIIIKHRLNLAPLTFGNSSHGQQHIGCGLGGSDGQPTRGNTKN